MKSHRKRVKGREKESESEKEKERERVKGRERALVYFLLNSGSLIVPF